MKNEIDISKSTETFHQLQMARCAKGARNKSRPLKGAAQCYHEQGILVILIAVICGGMLLVMIPL